MGAAASIEDCDTTKEETVEPLSSPKAVKNGLIGLSKKSEEETIDTLSSLRDLDEDKFERIMASVKFKSQHTKPLFPECKVS